MTNLATVRVAVATLWTGPSVVRPVDEPAIGVATDTRTWVRGLDDEGRLYDGVRTQLLLGEPVRVLAERDGWVRVLALAQPAAKLDPDGYPGWLPAAQLTTESAVDGEPYVVDATATALRDSPDGDVTLPGVVLGTRLPVVGPARRGWLPVRVPGVDSPQWTLERDVVPMPTGVPDRADVLEVARRLLDVPYVWGGLSPYGIDCSGLVHLAHRRFGVRVPRDANDQYDAASPVADDARPGHLYFFARPGRTVHHVGFVQAPSGHLVHADSTTGAVREEAMAPERVDTLIATGALT